MLPIEDDLDKQSGSSSLIFSDSGVGCKIRYILLRHTTDPEASLEEGHPDLVLPSSSSNAPKTGEPFPPQPAIQEAQPLQK